MLLLSEQSEIVASTLSSGRGVAKGGPCLGAVSSISDGQKFNAQCRANNGPFASHVGMRPSVGQ